MQRKGHLVTERAFGAIAIGLLCATTWSCLAEGPGDPQAQLNDLISRINRKIRDRQGQAEALAAEIGEFDKLLAQHAGQKTDEVANILYMKAKLYIQVFQDPATGVTLLQQVQKDFPATSRAADALFAKPNSAVRSTTPSLRTTSGG